MSQHPVFPHGLIQIAGVRSPREAEMLRQRGVDLLGIPLRLTVNEPDMSEAEASRLSQSLPGRCCLITYLNEERELVSLTRYLMVDVVQLHGDIDPALLPHLHRELPSVRWIKSLVIGRSEERALHKAMAAFSDHVWAFITDTYDPVTGAEGATGQTHDWAVSKRIVQASSRPVILAGGLNPSNVREAILRVRPAGVDVHTGVENASGDKDPQRVGAFVREARRGFKAAGLAP